MDSGRLCGVSGYSVVVVGGEDVSKVVLTEVSFKIKLT